MTPGYSITDSSTMHVEEYTPLTAVLMGILPLAETERISFISMLK